MQDLDISKMLTLSADHISEESLKMLYEGGFSDLEIYDKATYGFIVYINSCGRIVEDELTDDLKNIVYFTLEHGCNMFCLDRNADVIEGLECFGTKELIY